MTMRLSLGLACCIGMLGQHTLSPVGVGGGLAPRLIYQLEEEYQEAGQENGSIEVSVIMAHGVQTVATEEYSYPVFSDPINPAQHRAQEYVVERVPDLATAAGAMAGGAAGGVWGFGVSGAILSGEVGTGIAIGAAAGGFVGLVVGVFVGAM